MAGFRDIEAIEYNIDAVFNKTDTPNIRSARIRDLEVQEGYAYTISELSPEHQRRLAEIRKTP